MLKTLVTYYTKTGNTEKIAKSIYNAIKGNKDIVKMEEVKNLDDYDLVFIGFPIYNFEPVNNAKEFISKYAISKNIALFATMSLTAVPLNEQTKDLYNITINNCNNCCKDANLLGVFDCPGELSEVIAEKLISSNDPMLQMFGRIRNATIGFPNTKNIQDAAKFAVEIMNNK
jgi:flavodoxin